MNRVEVALTQPGRPPVATTVDGVRRALKMRRRSAGWWVIRHDGLLESTVPDLVVAVIRRRGSGPWGRWADEGAF